LPDVYITGPDHRRAYVEIEAGYHRQKVEKWQKQAALQGFVAVITKTRGQQTRVIHDIRAMGFAGKAGNLESLIRTRKAGGAEPIFHEQWGA